MPKKILRDLEKKGSLTVSLKEIDFQYEPPQKKELLNLGVNDPEKHVFAPEKNKKFDSIMAPGKPQKFVYLQIDATQQRKTFQIGEVIRLAATGIFILFIINLVNIYQKGVFILKDNVIATASSGYQNILDAGKQAKNAQYIQAENQFATAVIKFDEALDAINFLQSHENAFFVQEKTVTSAQNLLEAAKNIASAGKDFTKGIENLQNLPALILASSNGKDGLNNQESLTEKLKLDLVSINRAIAEIQNAQKNLLKVSPEVLPESLKIKLQKAQLVIDNISNVLTKTQEQIPAFLDLLGDRYPHRYLILLQNDTEVRPTGGFIGSYMLVDMNDGYITKMDFHDVYEADGQLQEEIPAPEDIAMISKNWRLRDSNYSPDFTISAEKAAWFLQKEKGPSVDTVIAINQSFLSDLLAITGPINVEGVRVPFDKDNYQLILSYIIESKLNGTETPKQVLGKFIDAVKAKIFTKEMIPSVLKSFMKGAQEKNILFYSRYENIQSLFDEFKLSSRIIHTTSVQDYLNLIVTSIGGNKSDRYIYQAIQHNTFVGQDGSLQDEITIARQHTWSQADLAQWQKTISYFGLEMPSETIKDILGRGVNKAMVKVYVPSGSELLDAFLIDKNKIMVRYDKDLDKTYFMFPMEVAPGDQQKVVLTYKLPYNLNFMPVDSYQFFAQSQSGIKNTTLEKKLLLKPEQQSYKTYPKEFSDKTKDNSIIFSGNFKEDLYLSALVGN